MTNLYHTKIIDNLTNNYIYNCFIHKYEDNIYILDDAQILNMFKSCNSIAIIPLFFSYYQNILQIIKEQNYKNFIQLMNQTIQNTSQINIEELLHLYLLCIKTIILYNNYFVYIKSSNLYYKIDIKINIIKQIYQKIMSFFISNNIGIFEKKNILFDI